MSIASKLRGLRAIWQFDNKIQLLIARLGLSNGVDVYEYKGVKILVDHTCGDAVGIRDCLTSDMYRRFLPSMTLPARSRVLDLGANVGGFSLLLKAERIEIDRLVCVELNPNTALRLTFNVRSNFGGEPICINAAVSGAIGERVIRLGRGGTGDSLQHCGAESSATDLAYTIHTTTLDQLWDAHFCPDPIDICKMDIEGAEHDVLFSESSRALRQIRYLLIEIHGNNNNTRQDAIAKIRSHGMIMLEPCSGLSVYAFRNTRF